MSLIRPGNRVRICSADTPRMADVDIAPDADGIVVCLDGKQLNVHMGTLWCLLPLLCCGCKMVCLFTAHEVAVRHMCRWGDCVGFPVPD